MEPPQGVQGIGIPFFSEAEWERARAVIDDADALCLTYREFIAKVQGFEQLFSRNGTPHLRVHVTIDQIRSWPGLRGRKIDAKVCAEYAAHRAQQQDDRNRRAG